MQLIGPNEFQEIFLSKSIENVKSLNGEVSQSAQTSNKLGGKKKKYKKLDDSKPLGDDDYLHAYNEGKRQRAKIEDWIKAADKGLKDLDEQIDINKWKKISTAGGHRWTTTFGRLWIGTVNLAIADSLGLYAGDFLKKEKEDGNRLAEDRLPFDHMGAWVAQRLKGRNRHQCLALTKHGGEILCQFCGFPRSWLKTYATYDKVQEAKLLACEYCGGNLGKLSIPPSPRFKAGYPCQWAVCSCTAMLATPEELGSHYYVKHYSISGKLEPPAHMAA